MKKLTRKQKMILGGVAVVVVAVVFILGGNHILQLIGGDPFAAINRPFGG